MNKRTSLLLPLLFLVAIAFNGCVQDKCEQTVTYLTYEPVYKSFEEIRAGVKSEAPRAVKNPSKIYFKDSFILMSELNEGIHVIDNNDPRNPNPIAFIAIPGTRDIAARGNVLYADSYTDMVALDISNLQNVSILGRQENVFPYGSWHNGLWADPDRGIAIDWVEKEVTEVHECGNSGFNVLPQNMFTFNQAVDLRADVLASNSQLESSVPSGGGELTTGVGGSFARFAITGNHLYTVTFSDMIVFDITDLSSPREVNRLGIGWDIETIWPKGDRLYIGTQTGMLVFSIANPEQPEWLTAVSHVQGCDPVVVGEEYAFSTIRDGRDCRSNTATNSLFVIDINPISSAFIAAEFPFTNPHGLGLRDDILFLCDGADGLKIFDASDPLRLNERQLAHFPDITAIDVIPLNNILIMVAEEGLYQYDYSDLNNIQQISLIPVERD